MNNEKPIKLIVDCSSGAEEYIAMEDEEIAQWEIEKEQSIARRAAEAAAAAAKAEAKASALAKLAALGLTEEEAAALAG